MNICKTLQANLPGMCKQFAAIFNMVDPQYLKQINTISDVASFRKWLGPITLKLAEGYNLRSSFRPQYNKYDPEQWDSFSFVFISPTGAEFFRLETTPNGFAVVCQGLFLAPGFDEATRFDGAALFAYVIKNGFPAFFLSQVLNNLGEPSTIRAREVWHEALEALDQAFTQQQPGTQQFKANVKQFFYFLTVVYGDLKAVEKNIEYVTKHRSNGRGVGTSETVKTLFLDDVIGIEVDKKGVSMVLDFATLSIGEKDSNFDPAKIAWAIRKSNHPEGYVEILFKALKAFRVFIKQGFDGAVEAEVLRQRVIRALNAMDDATSAHNQGHNKPACGSA